jgi:tetratricopeptide (TPR) repeat protein
LIEKNYEDFANSEMLKIQFAWLKYDAFVSKYKKSGDWESLINIADEILTLNPEDGEILFRLTLFAAIDAAKRLKDYEKVLELTEMTSPSKLPGKPESYKGRKMISWRERWYFARLYALFTAQLYEECRELAFAAFKAYPRKIEFARKAALSLEQMGQPVDAEKEIASLTSVRGCPWYIFADLARIRFEAGNYEGALESAYTGVLRRGELKTKVNLFSLIAKILVITGETELAVKHVELACSVRNKQGWKIPEDLANLKQRFDLTDELPEPEILEKQCRKNWEQNQKVESAVKDNKSQQPFENEVTGVMGQIKEGRPFTFIKCPAREESIYVKIADIDTQAQYENCQVVFDLIESFDHKKGVKSVRAVNVRATQQVTLAA